MQLKSCEVEVEDVVVVVVVVAGAEVGMLEEAEELHPEKQRRKLRSRWR